MATVDEIRRDEDGVVPTERKRWPPDDDKRGLECRHCGCRHFRIIHVRSLKDGRIMRRRECRYCGKQVSA